MLHGVVSQKKHLKQMKMSQKKHLKQMKVSQHNTEKHHEQIKLSQQNSKKKKKRIFAYAPIMDLKHIVLALFFF